MGSNFKVLKRGTDLDIAFSRRQAEQQNTEQQYSRLGLIKHCKELYIAQAEVTNALDYV
jgi:hypothetical protein